MSSTQTVRGNAAPAVTDPGGVWKASLAAAAALMCQVKALLDALAPWVSVAVTVTEYVAGAVVCTVPEMVPVDD